MHRSLPSDFATPQGVRASCPHLRLKRDRRSPQVLELSLQGARASCPHLPLKRARSLLVLELFRPMSRWARTPTLLEVAPCPHGSMRRARRTALGLALSLQGARASCPHLPMKRVRKTSLMLELSRSMSRWARTPTLLEASCPHDQGARASCPHLPMKRVLKTSLALEPFAIHEQVGGDAHPP